MLGYRKKSFYRAHAMLQTLRKKPEDLETLRSIQRLLCAEIIRAERKIRELKADLKNARKEGGDNAAKRTSFLQNRIEGVRQCAYIWRCFGDAIAFTYMDKFALKQCFINIENMKARNLPGFLSDKSGLLHEIANLEFALDSGVPAILTDLTNTIRHGDICLMGGSDPHLIEVKASERLNDRGRRQKRNLVKLMDFLETDEAQAFRGFSSVRRTAFESPEQTYISELSSCISEAHTNGHAVRSPESGLFYIVFYGESKNVGAVISSLNLTNPWLFQLNEIKTQRAWSPYSPFILSIEDKDRLLDFIRGNLYIMVILEFDTLCKIATECGYESKGDPGNPQYSLFIDVPGADGPSGVSQQLLARVGMEFVSPKWMVKSLIEMIQRGIKDAIARSEADAVVDL